MADYKLHGLNPRDFQHLIQAIARKQIAAGVTAFGDGKDGARDLSFNGEMNYPSLTNHWNGYLILGCKFLQKPTGDNKKDKEWAISQLQLDLKKYIGRKYKLPKPEYYLFVTNINLSGVARTGGRDRVVSLLTKYKSKIGLKDFSVWDYNDIRGFLDGDHDIRTAYGHFITSGDILAKLAQTLKFEKSDFVDVMHSFLQKELIADMSAKLQAAGEDPEAQIPLENVFVDLPFAHSSEAATLIKQKEQGKSPLVIDYLLQAGMAVHRETTDEVKTIINERDKSHRRTSRFVIIGGPGQGKSTLGQFLCQLYRAAILKDRHHRFLFPKVVDIINRLETQREDFGGLPIGRRFPLRIELRAFSNCLANQKNLTLFEYIRREISRLGNIDVALIDLKNWLKQYPWLLVLDGLDEVPPSSNRSDVLKQIEHFRIDAVSDNADLMVVATTRPQSYSNEFSEDSFEYLYLMSLTPKQALDYGRKLAEARCGAEDRRREELISSLEKASKNEATIRLMQSPLQVTIMATLLEDTGEPPQQRYRLFFEYYRTIYKRETRRRLLGGILSERQTDIDMIHFHAGLLLHLSGETTKSHCTENGKKDIESALSDKQFRELVKTRLEKIKLPSSQITGLLDKITDSSLQRLVFLVRQKEGFVRFDITSFKEFMAAEAVMIGADDEVKQRLQSIAPAMYWRNVFLFTVGKCFVQREHMLDSIVGICTDLNEERAAGKVLKNKLAGDAAKATLWGSRLALDILIDGTARQYPEYEVRLAKLALELVRFGDVETAVNLAAIYHDDLKDLFLETIKERLDHSCFWHQLGAWHLMLSLSDRDIEWAINLVEQKWPKDAIEQTYLLSSHVHTIRKKWWFSRILETAPKVKPFFLLRHIHTEYRRSYKELPDPWPDFMKNISSNKNTLGLNNHSRWINLFPKFRIVPINFNLSYCQKMKSLPVEDPSWFPLISGARFGENPNAHTLANELEWLSKSTFTNTIYGLIPWPLRACIDSAQSVNDLARLAKLARDGQLGDTKDWKEAETRWQKKGIIDIDIEYMTDEHWPFDSNIAQIGFPLSIANIEYEIPSKFQNYFLVIDEICSETKSKRNAWLASIILNHVIHSSFYEENVMLSPDQHRKIFELSHCGPSSRRFFNWFPLDRMVTRFFTHRIAPEIIDYLDWIGRQKYELGLLNDTIPFIDELNHHFCLDPEGKIGLLTLITLAAESGNKCTIPRRILDRISISSNSISVKPGFLVLSAEDLNENDIIIIVSQLNHSEIPTQEVERTLKIASTISRERKDRIALQILSVFSSDDIEHSKSIDIARKALLESLTGRSSNADPRNFIPEFEILNKA